MAQSEKELVLAANAAFYVAFSSNDLAAMDALWSATRNVVVFHPNWQGIKGRDAVMRSWAAIMDDSGPTEIRPLDACVVITGKTAMVVCEEDLVAVRMIATNIFINEGGTWRMVHHQATRLPEAAQDQPEKSRRNGQRSPGP